MAATITQVNTIQLIQHHNNNNNNNHSNNITTPSNTTYNGNRLAIVGSNSTNTTSNTPLVSSANNGRHMPYGLGLLTTVASLPPKYRSRYLNIKTKTEIPLDLSVKPTSPQIASDVPVATSFTEVYTEPQVNNTELVTVESSNSEMIVSAVKINDIRVASEEVEDFIVEELVSEHAMDDQVAIGAAEHQVQSDSGIVTILNFKNSNNYNNKSANNNSNNNNNNNNDNVNKNNNNNNIIMELTKPIITPPPTPTKRKFSEHSLSDINDTDALVERIIAETYTNPIKMSKTTENPTTKRDSTPVKPIRSRESAPKTIKAEPPASKSSKSKATRKLKFDEETSSPVSGTIIRPLEDITDGLVQYSNGDIDPKYNIVEITEETKAELAAIKNVIGDFICKLCRLKFDDAFGLARHRCACIVLLEYRCPECGKQFNCPANLASHRRWHKPKKENQTNSSNSKSSSNQNNLIAKKENRNTTNFGGNYKMELQQSQGKSKSESLLTTTQTTKTVITTKTTTTMTTMANNLPGAKKPDDTTYACEQCGKKFKRQAYLRKHQLSHEGSVEVPKATTTTTSEKFASQSEAMSVIGNSTSKTKILAAKVRNIISAKAKTSTVTILSPAMSNDVPIIHQQQHHNDNDSSAASSLLSLNSMHSKGNDCSAGHSIDGVYEDRSIATAAGLATSNIVYKYSSPSSSQKCSDFVVDQQSQQRMQQQHNYNTRVENVNVYGSNHGDIEDNDDTDDSMSDYSTSSTGYGRLQIVETGLTEEENIAAAALTNLRNCASVIQHTTLAH